MIKVRYNQQFSQDGYEYRYFDNYEDFGYWYYENYKRIIIWSIEEEENS